MRPDPLILAAIRAVVLNEVEQLPEPQRTLIWATFLGNQSLREVAIRLNIPYATAWSHHRGALLTMRERLQDHWIVKGYFDIMYPDEEHPTA